MQDVIREYLVAVEAAIAKLDPAAIEAVVRVVHAAYQNDNQVFTMGNGASAALASHMACDLGKGTAADLGQGPAVSGAKRLRIIGLADNVALMTAYGNDIRYDDVFVEQLKNLLNEGDVVIGISGSGGSPNVLRALEYARARGAVTVGFTGAQPKAELLRSRCDYTLAAPLDLMEQIEDIHVIFHHVISLALRRLILGHGAGGC
ncbi:MAG TPA: SIS domain-containing protein [Symbiobacteriaceae bacterium]|nr:SIS domain-containing protein [Symbiobacteriaceae bacterium]